ncbi:hypothetical protein BD779DRAFT_1609024 [Infundibulicybe gibba]|nr:hypothetical protein BD779DRAFT_1609024 [Infundibulicybe gibba]
MGDIQNRPFSKNYSGLVNQTVIGLAITVLCVTGQELMKRKRRGKQLGGGLGSRESWEFGYLYQGRSWARYYSPPSPGGWPLSWVRQVTAFSEERLNKLRGIDATLYVRFLRGCFWFALVHTFTTFPILFPIHVEFADGSVPPKSMARASMSSLVDTEKGRSLLWIHICLLFWITLSWMCTLLWVCNGAFRLRASNIEAASREAAVPASERCTQYHPHPHPQYGFADVPELDCDKLNSGLRLRTIMVSNLPVQLRNEKELKEYFEFYMSRKLEKPSLGLTSSTQPGFLNKWFAFFFNRAKRLPNHLPTTFLGPALPGQSDSAEGADKEGGSHSADDTPVIERVVVVRKMSELASLLERREEILRLLETAHIKLANKTLLAVKQAMDRQEANKPFSHCSSKATEVVAERRRSMAVDVEGGRIVNGMDEESRMQQLIRTLGRFVQDFHPRSSLGGRSKKAISRSSKYAFRKLRMHGSEHSGPSTTQTHPISPMNSGPEETVWDALLSLPRGHLDAYQPLVHLNHLFRGKTVPSIDYYTAKLNLLSALITEQRAKAVADYEPVSTAFVTFSDPGDARRACKYLAVHPNNPLNCLVTMAPMYQDIDWTRMMKSSFNAEFVKDWVVNLGVWGFTLFWLFPVSLLVGLVSIKNISVFWPGLKAYLNRHPWEEEVIESFLPTLLVALLALLIPLILLLIAKKAHTITTLSALHDRIMTRYYKFLIVNVVVFFCVGTAALQSFLESFRSTTHPDVLNVVALSFPTAGPFYVGWLIFTTAMHNGFEISLVGLPLIMYPTTRRQVTPRKRAVGIRPRTFNYYYWLPNHLLVIQVLLLFAILNPFVLPFGALYFLVASSVVKNQFIHVYAKHYEGNGQLLLIRILRYSSDGLILTQAVFLAYMVVLKKTVNVGLSAVLIILTSVFKIMITRICRAQFEKDDIKEAEILCGIGGERPSDDGCDESGNVAHDQDGRNLLTGAQSRPSVFTWRLPAWVNLSYKTIRHHPHHQRRRRPNPFGPPSQSLTQTSMSREAHLMNHLPQERQVEPYSHDYQWGISQSGPTEGDITNIKIDLRPVVPHPSPITWDDQTTVDLPYDNPYYTREIASTLWLPRDPCGILNLDDTVDMKVSLTVEVSAGQLGSWLGLGETSSPLLMSDTSSDLPSPRLPRSLTAAVPLPQVDGTEEIDLPLTIAKRVQAKEDDVEQTIRPRRPSAYQRKVSSGDQSTMARRTTRRRPSVLDPPLPTFRSFSDGNTTGGRGRSSSIMSALQLPPRRHRSRSTDHEFGILSSPQASPELANASTSRVSLAPPPLSRTQNVSTRQAIVHEVLAEEVDAMANRLEEEEAEANKAKSTKSWLTSWMFKKRTE